MHKADNTFVINTGANGGDLRPKQIVCLLRDLAQRLAKGKGVDSDDARRQLHAINRAARQVLVARRTAAAPTSERGTAVSEVGVAKTYP
jgi:hypothetical protein